MSENEKIFYYKSRIFKYCETGILDAIVCCIEEQ